MKRSTGSLADLRPGQVLAIAVISERATATSDVRASGGSSDTVRHPDI